MEDMLKLIFLFLIIKCLNAEICLPIASCSEEQPLCRSCLPGDSCIEPRTMEEGFCGPYKDYSENQEMSRQKRYGACKDAAIARSLPSERDFLTNLRNKYFYKNCIQGEFMCGDGSCQVSDADCLSRDGILFYPSTYSNCTSTANPSEDFWMFDIVIRLSAVDDEQDTISDLDVNSKLLNSPEKLSTGELVKFCTYFFEVVILGGAKQRKATDLYVEFLYSCFQDYETHRTNALVHTMNEFYELSGQRAVRNLNIFDARNYPGIPAIQIQGS